MRFLGHGLVFRSTHQIFGSDHSIKVGSIPLWFNQKELGWCLMVKVLLITTKISRRRLGGNHRRPIGIRLFLKLSLPTKAISEPR